MDELVGKTITGLAVGDGESSMRFQTTEGDVAYHTEGDCCSETWFAEVLGVSYLIGHKVASVENLELEDVVDGHSRQEDDKFYGVRLTTEAGHVTIVYRNSSNGYYCGSICLFEPKEPAGWRPITDDWTAHG